MHRSPAPALWTRRLTLIALAFVLAVASFAAGILTARATTAPKTGAEASAWVEPPMGRLPSAELCIVDHTEGMPVAEAAAEFDGLVAMRIDDDCAGATSVVLVRVVIRDESWSGWFNSASDDRGGAALISLNVGQAFRLDPDGWRMALVHELGHAVGLGHAKTGVMDPVHYAEHDHLTDQEVARIRDLYGL